MTPRNALLVRVALVLAIAVVLLIVMRPDPPPPSAPGSGSACESLDPVLADSSFVLLAEPAPGARMSSPLAARGCSRTFESNVLWELRARDGSVLAKGNVRGGGVDGAAPFAIAAPFAVSEPQLGHLEVYAPDPSEGEGFPPGRSVIPLVLLPGP